MAAGGVRLARGWAGASVATFLSVLSHLMAGGGPPQTAVLLLSLALSGLVCTLLAGRVLSLWRLVAGVTLSQAVFHWLFSADAAMAGTTAIMPQGAHAVHAMTAMPVLNVAGGGAAMQHDSSVMWLCHAIAAVATVAVLRHGEVTAVRLLRALRMRLVRLLPAFRPLALSPTSRIQPASWPVLVLPSLGVPLLAMRHRGPPALSLPS